MTPFMWLAIFIVPFGLIYYRLKLGNWLSVGFNFVPLFYLLCFGYWAMRYGFTKATEKSIFWIVKK
jgi:hypothetical protein